MFNRFKSKPISYERDKKVTLVGETDSEGKIFITGYHKEPSTMNANTPKVEIGSAGTLTPPFPNTVDQTGAETAVPAEETPVAGAEMPASAEEMPASAEEMPASAEEMAGPGAEMTGPGVLPPVPPPKPPRPDAMGPVPPLFTEEMNQGGRKSRRYKKTGKKQKGGKLRRKSRKQRK